MADLLAMLAQNATGNTDLTSVENVLCEQRLRSAAQQLADIAALSDTLSAIGQELTEKAHLPHLEMKQLRPLQEKTRIATSLIRGHIYLHEMRMTAEATALAALRDTLAGPASAEDENENEKKSDAPSPAPHMPQLAEAAKTPVKKASPPQATRKTPSKHMASLARHKKNQRRRAADKEQNKNKSPIAALRHRLSAAQKLAAATQNDIATTMPGPRARAWHILRALILIRLVGLNLSRRPSPLQRGWLAQINGRDKTPKQGSPPRRAWQDVS